MNSLVTSVATTAPGPAGLAFECAVMAGRLAALLRQRFAGDEAPVAAALGFLEHQYQALACGRALGDNRALLEERREQGGDPVLTRLRQVWGLSDLETDLLILAGLAEQHEGYADIYRTLHPTGQPYPTLGLAAQVLCAEGQRQTLREQLAGGAAINLQLLKLQGDTAFYALHLVLAEALWPLMSGIEAWPRGLRPDSSGAVLAGLTEWLQEAPVARATQALLADAPCTIVINAESETVAGQRAAALVEGAGRPALRLLWPKTPEAGFELLVQIHAAARGAVPVLSLQAPDNGASFSVTPLVDFPGPVLLCSHTGVGMVDGRRPLLNIQIESLGALALRQMWGEILPEMAEQAGLLAARYPLEPAVAAQVARDLALVRPAEAGPLGLRDVAESLRSRAAINLGSGVQRLRPLAGWPQLVLPDTALGQLREAVSRLDLQALVLDDWRFLEGRRGARGVRMLFSGPPGTGKSLSAEVLANALGVDLLLVDLSRVVSKWIGETEKNLAEVFESAERAKAVLFFDEADALFGKRTEVSDSHDRYANLETAYLLSRLERFDGLAILATNLRQNIDPAFSRRLEFVIEYEEPAYEQRLALWRCHLPPDAPLAADVNLEALAARFPIVGGLIRNAAVAAAFLAAGEGNVITKNHFIRAIRREYEKAGKAYRELPGRTHGHSCSP